MGRKREEVNYLSFDDALFMAQSKCRIELYSIQHRLRELRRIYTDTPSYLNDGTQINWEGLTVIETAAAEVAGAVLAELFLHYGVGPWKDAPALIRDARAFQTSKWTSLVEPDRTLEEWILLTFEYMARFEAICEDVESKRERQIKYLVIVANLALWAVQAARGYKPGEVTTAPHKPEDGHSYHYTPEEPGLTAGQGKDSIGQ